MSGSKSDFGLPEGCDPRVLALASYWGGCRLDSALPGRQHVDPVAMPAPLANIWLLDVQRKPVRFRFRLVGTRVVEFLGQDPTGHWVDEAYPSFAGSLIEADFAGCIRTGRPAWRCGPPVMNVAKDFARVERIALPLARNGRDVDMLLCMSLYER